MTEIIARQHSKLVTMFSNFKSIIFKNIFMAEKIKITYQHNYPPMGSDDHSVLYIDYTQNNALNVKDVWLDKNYKTN